MYKAFEPAEARRLLERLEIHYTPKHGSWLDVAEIELSVFTKQCLARRIDNIETLRSEAKAWADARNAAQTGVDWQFSNEQARIKLGLQERLYLGNLDAKRDWGHARGYVRIQWLMLQQDHPEDYVIAAGEQHSVRDFVEQAAGEIGIEIRWEGSGVDEKGYAIAPFDPVASWGRGGEERCIVAVDPRYFRPTEVDTLLGDASKARRQLGWEPEISFAQLVAETMCADLKDAKRDALVRGEGYPHSERSESKRGRAPAIRRN